jgi:hypothetical protein
MQISRRDLELLEFISEQYVATEDQLARLLGRSPATARRWARAMRDGGLCRRELLIRGEPARVWLTGRGARRTKHGFHPWRGHLGKLDHIGAVFDLRLHVAAQVPEAGWVSERELFSRQADEHFGRGGEERRDAPHVPDAELVMPNGDRHALEVELTRKSKQRLAGILAELGERYDVVVYFCGGTAVQDAVTAGIPTALTRKIHVRDLGEVIAYPSE